MGGGCRRESTYSVVRLTGGRESTVSTSDLAPYPPSHDENKDPPYTASAMPETRMWAMMTCEG